MDSGKDLGGLLDDRTAGFEDEEGGDDSGDEAAELSEAERRRNRRRCRPFIDGQRWVCAGTKSGEALTEERNDIVQANRAEQGRSRPDTRTVQLGDISDNFLFFLFVYILLMGVGVAG